MRIYLRLMDDPPSGEPEEVRLKAVIHAVEAALGIRWEVEPEPHPRGGYAMVGQVPNDVDLDGKLQELKKTGYISVI